MALQRSPLQCASISSHQSGRHPPTPVGASSSSSSSSIPPPSMPRHPPHVTRVLIDNGIEGAESVNTGNSFCCRTRQRSRECLLSFAAIPPGRTALRNLATGERLGRQFGRHQDRGGLEQQRFGRCHPRIGTYSGAAAAYGRRSGTGSVPRMIYTLICRQLPDAPYTSVAI